FLGYLLLLRFQMVVIPNALAVVLAVAVGWAWPEALERGRDWHAQLGPAARELPQGTESLTLLAVRHARAVACLRGVAGADGATVDHRVAFVEQPARLLDYLLQLRNARLSAFRHYRGAPADPALCWAHEWEAEAGELGPGVRVVDDPEALGGRAVESTGA